MALDASKVRVGVTGVVAYGALAATAPTTATSTISTFTDCGYVSEDGLTESRDQTTESIRAWQNAAKVRETVTEGEITYSFTLIQTDAAVVALAYDSAPDASGAVILQPALSRQHRSFVIDVIDGAEVIRHWIPDGQISELGDVVYQNGAPIGYEMTLTAFPHSSLASGAGSVKKWFKSLATA